MGFPHGGGIQFLQVPRASVRAVLFWCDHHPWAPDTASIMPSAMFQAISCFTLFFQRQQQSTHQHQSLTVGSCNLMVFLLFLVMVGAGMYWILLIWNVPLSIFTVGACWFPLMEIRWYQFSMELIFYAALLFASIDVLLLNAGVGKSKGNIS